MAIVYIGLGSNLGDREEQVLRAVHEMRAFARVKKISTLYETKPVGIIDQPNFLNAVVEIETDYSPREVMDELLRIESEMGRVRTVKGGPREIDLDILAFDDQIVEDSELRVPHPELHHRRFALAPMAELNPKWVHPLSKKGIQDLLAELPADED